jgi:hypothetical protein
VREPKAWKQRPTPLPWTPEEDAKLEDMTRLGVVSEAWPVQLPNRRFYEIVERRLELGLRCAPLL